MIDYMQFCKNPCPTNTADDSCSSPVKKMLGSVPPGVQQAAVRAQAQSLQQENQLAQAAALLRTLVEQQDQGQLQHEMCADYGSILRQQGKLEVS